MLRGIPAGVEFEVDKNWIIFRTSRFENFAFLQKRSVSSFLQDSPKFQNPNIRQKMGRFDWFWQFDSQFGHIGQV